MKKTVSYIIFIMLISVAFIYLMNNKFSNKDNVEIHIGYQSVTSQTWSALIMKNKRIFETKLQTLYPNKKIKVIWHDEISGAVINTSMISNKYQFGFMGDMPLLLNMYKAETLKNYNSTLIAFDGKGINGKNQSILVPKGSKVKTVFDLKGKTISVPIGSSAHFMLLKVLQKKDLLDEVDIVHQDVALASQLLSTKKTDAFSIWAPYPNFLSEEGYGEILIDGVESEIDYLAGIIVNKNWADNNEKIVNIFIESLDETHEFIINNPKEAAKIFSSESRFSYNITKKEVESITWDSKITEKDIKTLEEKMKFLIDIDQMDKYNLKNHIYNIKGSD